MNADVEGGSEVCGRIRGSNEPVDENLTCLAQQSDDGGTLETSNAVRTVRYSTKIQGKKMTTFERL